MLLILAIIATSLVAPVHEGDVDTQHRAFMRGKVDWDINAGHAVVSVTGSNGFSGSETVLYPGDYNINLGFPAEGTTFTVNCAWIIGSPPYLVDVRSGIVYSDDFHQIFPQRYWVHYENFVL